MQVLSLVWGILAVIGMLVGFFPLFRHLELAQHSLRRDRCHNQRRCSRHYQGAEQGCEYSRSYLLLHRSAVRDRAPGNWRWRRVERLPRACVLRASGWRHPPCRRFPVFLARIGSSFTASTVTNRGTSMCAVTGPSASSGSNPLSWRTITASRQRN